MADRKDDETREARRILDRIAREEPSAPRFVTRFQNHLTAADADPEDQVDVWGTRIGRTLGVIITVGLLIWVGSYLFGSS